MTESAWAAVIFSLLFGESEGRNKRGRFKFGHKTFNAHDGNATNGTFEFHWIAQGFFFIYFFYQDLILTLIQNRTSTFGIKENYEIKP